MERHTSEGSECAGSRPLNVAYLTMAFPSPSEPFAGSDVRALLRTGVRVSVHSLRPRHAEATRLIEQWELASVEHTHNGVRSSLSGLWNLLRRPRLVPLIWRLMLQVARRPRHFVRTLVLVPRFVDILTALERSRPDVVHAFWGHYPAFVITLVQHRLPGIVTSIFLGAYDLEEEYPLTKVALAAADLTWTHARANREALQAAGAREQTMSVAYRGIDLAQVPLCVQKERGKIITAGRLIASKGTELVIDAFHSVRTTHPGVTLVILGEGPERAALEQRCRDLGLFDAVLFRGHVDHQAVLHELATSQIMLLLSRKTSERLPNAVKEAMACGCFCIVSDTPGIREAIPDRTHGVVLKTTGPEVVAMHIRRALDDPVDLAGVGHAARQHIENHFDAGKNMRAYVEAWERAVGRGHLMTPVPPGETTSPRRQ